MASNARASQRHSKYPQCLSDPIAPAGTGYARLSIVMQMDTAMTTRVRLQIGASGNRRKVTTGSVVMVGRGAN